MSKFIDAISMYGISHGLITAAALGAAWFFPWPVYLLVGIAAAYAYWDRESEARKRDGTPKFRDWYLDSQMDAVVPVIVVIVGFWLRFA